MLFRSPAPSNPHYSLFTVFGTVVEGMNNVDLMAQVARDPQDNPIEPVYITNTTLMSKSDFDQMKADAK